MKTGVEMARKSVNKTGIKFEKNDVLRGRSRDKKFNADEQRDKQTDRQAGSHPNETMCWSMNK